MSFALRVQETTTDDEILIDDYRCDSEMDRSIVGGFVGMEVGLESGQSNTGIN